MAPPVSIFASPPKTVEEKLLDLFVGFDPDAAAGSRAQEFVEARRDFGAFMRLITPGYIEGWHLDMLRNTLAQVERGEITRLIVTCPPRHGKSLHVSEGFPAWYLGRNPDHRVIAAAHTQRLADKFSGKVRGKFSSPFWPFPDARIDREHGGVTGWDIEGSETGSYFPVGVGGTPTGLGGELIIIDDPLKSRADAESATIRDKLWEWYEGTVYTRRQPGARFIVTSTRYHEDDLTGRLLKKQEEGGDQWHHLFLPAIDEEENILWPEFWDEKYYADSRMASDREWQAQYMGSPTRREGNLLKEEWFPEATPGEEYYAVIQAWDTASKPGISNDYSVCATIGVGVNCYDVLHIWRDKVEFPELVQAAKDQATWAQANFPASAFTVAIEDANSGTQLIQTLNRDTRLPVIPVGSANTFDAKTERVISMTPIAKARRIRLLTGASWRSDLMREFKGFPSEAHDDIVDAVMIGVQKASDQGTAMASTRDYIQDQKNRVIIDGRGRRRPPPPRPS